MPRTSLKIAIGALAVFFGAMEVVPDDADARRFGGRARVGRINVNRNIARNVNRGVVRRNVRRAGRWVNGVWVVNGVAASVAVGTASNCGYYWRKWKATGHSYWHDRWQESCT